MDKNTHKLIVVSYELYSVENGEEIFVEKTDEQKPLQFYTGCDMALPAFEKAVKELNTDSEFDFNLSPEEAYGEFNPESVLDLDKTIFSHQGVFDEANVFVDAMLPLQNEKGDRFIGRVLEISDDKVKIDLNHPMAGKTLHFKGRIMENREATEEEVNDFLESMRSHHCGGGCHGGCGGGDSKGTADAATTMKAVDVAADVTHNIKQIKDAQYFRNTFHTDDLWREHGAAIGGIVDGMPAGIDIDMEFIQSELNRRKPGQSKITTDRKEDDQVEMLSGIFEGKSTGAPIGFIVRNKSHRSQDYENIRDLFRPSHADYTYYKKYGIRDYRGGGRSSARITLARVVAGALARLVLNKYGITIQAYTSQVGSISLAETTNSMTSRKRKRTQCAAPIQTKHRKWKD